MKQQKYWEFSQNNSGGDFVLDDKVCHRLFIEAENENKAIEIAVKLGVYFDGVDDGTDCGCCGDRWNSPTDVIFPHSYSSLPETEAREIADKYKQEAIKKDTPHWRGGGAYDVVFNDVEPYAQYLADSHGWTTPDARIYYSNGRVKEIFKA